MIATVPSRSADSSSPRQHVSGLSSQPLSAPRTIGAESQRQQLLAWRGLQTDGNRILCWANPQLRVTPSWMKRITPPRRPGAALSASSQLERGRHGDTRAPTARACVFDVLVPGPTVSELIGDGFSPITSAMPPGIERCARSKVVKTTA
jgi:hypothetical protein